MTTSKSTLKFNGGEQKEFFQVLRKRVDQYFAERSISKHANAAMVFKTVVMLLLYFTPYTLLLVIPLPFSVQLLMWVIMGLGLAGIGMSIMHDANHGAYSSNKTINKLLGHSLNLIGGSVFNWKLQHNILHHTYTNVVHYDDDIADKLILRMSPHTEVKKVHRFQFLYAFVFYSIVTLYWALAKDLIQFRNYIRRGVNPQNKAQNRVTLFKIIISKLFYFGYVLAIPLLVTDLPFAQVITGFLLMHLFAGFILTFIFQLAHTVEGTAHPQPDKNGSIENNWAIHQLQTTVDFATDNKLLSFYIGGLNFQVEHHLFPRICHIHYPHLAPIVKATAEEFGLKYMVNHRFSDAISSHIRTLQRFGRLESELIN